MATVLDLRNATLAARVRTNDNGIGTQVEAGRVQVVRVAYPPGKRGRSVVTPVSDFLTIEEAIRVLERL